MDRVTEVAKKMAEFYHPHQEFNGLPDGVKADLMYFSGEICQLFDSTFVEDAETYCREAGWREPD